MDRLSGDAMGQKYGHAAGLLGLACLVPAPVFSFYSFYALDTTGYLTAMGVYVDPIRELGASALLKYMGFGYTLLGIVLLLGALLSIAGTRARHVAAIGTGVACYVAVDALLVVLLFTVGLKHEGHALYGLDQHLTAFTFLYGEVLLGPVKVSWYLGPNFYLLLAGAAAGTMQARALRPAASPVPRERELGGGFDDDPFDLGRDREKRERDRLRPGKIDEITRLFRWITVDGLCEKLGVSLTRGDEIQDTIARMVSKHEIDGYFEENTFVRVLPKPKLTWKETVAVLDAARPAIDGYIASHPGPDLHELKAALKLEDVDDETLEEFIKGIGQ